MPKDKAPKNCAESLFTAYQFGDLRGGEVDWEDLDIAAGEAEREITPARKRELRAWCKRIYNSN